MDNVQIFGLLGIVAIFALGYFVYNSKKKSAGRGTGKGGSSPAHTPTKSQER